MNNAEKYLFKDFTFKEYRELLEIASQNYIFRNFTNFQENENFIIWRHDVDFSLINAWELAKIEKEYNIKSTFFILLHSEFYNPLEYNSYKMLNEIKNSGHDIGLHFDSHFYKADSIECIEKYLIIEKELFKKIFHFDLRVFSFHNSDEFLLKCENSHYAGLINTSSVYFKTKVGYCSDSNGYWRFKRLKDVLTEATENRLQILTHPVWWSDKIMSPKEKVYKAADDRAENSKRNYDKLLIDYKRNNIDW